MKFTQYYEGLFGFMSSWAGEDAQADVGGNFGLLDQQLAIKV